MGVHCESCCLTGASCSSVSQGHEASHKSWFQPGLVYSQTHKRHHSSTFSSPPSLGEAARIHKLTQLEILQAHWKCRGGRRHAWTRLSVWALHDFHSHTTVTSCFSPLRNALFLWFRCIGWNMILPPAWPRPLFHNRMRIHSLSIQSIEEVPAVIKCTFWKAFAFYSLCWEHKRAV